MSEFDAALEDLVFAIERYKDGLTTREYIKISITRVVAAVARRAATQAATEALESPNPTEPYTRILERMLELSRR